MASRSNQPVKPVYNRKIARYQLKNRQGNNKIQRAWRRIQIIRYGGFKNYVKMRMAKAARGEGRELLPKLYSGLEG